MPLPIFIFFSLLAAGGAISLILVKNPVTSAMSMVVSFVAMAALFIGMNAYFVGIMQILVYTGAIMVLFLFIIMLLDLKTDRKSKPRIASILGAIIVPAILVVQLLGILGDTPEATRPDLNPQAEMVNYTEGSTIYNKLKENRIPDVNLIGNKLFQEYNFPLQVMGVLLLVATVGCVVLSKKDEPAKG